MRTTFERSSGPGPSSALPGQQPARRDDHGARNRRDMSGSTSRRARPRLPLRLSIAAGVATLLGSLGLAALFVGGGWFPPVLLGIGCVVVGANLSRLAGLPMWMSAPTALLALLTGLTVLYSGGHAALGIIPTPAAMAALRGQFAEGAGYIARTSVPAEPQPGVVALVVTGVGIVAILVEMCAVTLRRAAVGGYPLLILAAVPMIVIETDLPWWTFATAAGGYIILLGAAHADATARWGSHVPPYSDTSAIGLLARPAYLLGLGGILAAIALSAAVPGSSGQGWFTGFDALEDFGADRGRSIETVHPFTSLRGELNQANPSELLRVRTDDPEPFYLRLTSLARFTGQGWTQSRLRAGGGAKVSEWEGREPPLDATVPRVQQRTEIEVRGLSDSSYLPLYANPTTISVDGDWRWDGNTETVFSARDRTAGLNYEFTSQRVPYTGDLLAAAPPVSETSRLFEEYTAPDGPIRSQLRGLVEELAPSGRSQLDTVRAIEEHFDEANGFRYTERTTAGSSGDALVDFLANKQGFCEQYASAMAYLVRAAGIPARVAIGFARGREVQEGSGNYISVNSRDAHAWVEVYFRGLGWVPFDPTPSAGPGRTADTSWEQQPDASAPTSSTGPSATTTPDGAVTTPEPGAAPNAPAPDAASPTQQTAWTGRWPTLLGYGVLGLMAVTLLTGPAVLRGWERRRRLRRIRHATTAEPGAGSGEASSATLVHGVLARATEGAHAYDAAAAAWQELTDTAYDLRLLPADWTRPAAVWRARHTPRELFAQLRKHQLSERDARAVMVIVAAQERNRYARDAGTAKGLYAAVQAANGAMASRASGAARLMASLWPRSVGESAVHVAATHLSIWRASAARSAGETRQGLRRAYERGAETVRSLRLRRVDGANAVLGGRAGSSGRRIRR